MNDIKLNLRIILCVVSIYFVGKFILRPYVLARGFPEFVNVLVLSLPNFCEALCGLLLLTNLTLIINYHLLDKKLSLQVIYLSVTLFTAIYVTLQELKIHNLGGDNIYDPYDVVYSAAGVLLGYLFLLVKRPIYEPNK